MIEAYAFFAMFSLQIVVASVLYPALFIRYLRAQAASIPAERVTKLYPGIDLNLASARFFTQYRTLHALIAGLGLLLLGWLVRYMHRPDWVDGPVEALITAYFMLQFLVPLLLVVWIGIRYKVHKQLLLQSKRKALLQRRGLFDFISPWAVATAVLCYLLFAAFVFLIEQEPFQGFAGYLTLGIVTLGFAVEACFVYAALYGKKPNPFESHAARARMTGMVVKSCVYSCIACLVFLSLNFTLVMLDLQRWEPFALSVFFVISALLALMGLTGQPRESEADGLGVT